MEDRIQDGLQIPSDNFLGDSIADRWHMPTELHSNPSSLWDRLRLPIRFIRFVVAGSLS
jgi:hypothetical protein